MKFVQHCCPDYILGLLSIRLFSGIFQHRVCWKWHRSSLAFVDTSLLFIYFSISILVCGILTASSFIVFSFQFKCWLFSFGIYCVLSSSIDFSWHQMRTLGVEYYLFVYYTSVLTCIILLSISWSSNDVSINLLLPL